MDTATMPTGEAIITAAHKQALGALTNYDEWELAKATLALCEAVNKHADDSFAWYYVGEDSEATTSDLIVGLFWHYSEWHGGQSHITYAALSALGTIYSPGMMDGPEPDSPEEWVYNFAGEMAQAQQTS